MFRFATTLTAVLLLFSDAGSAPACAQQGRKEPRITIGRQTTFLTEPIGTDGYINYVAALDAKLREGVAPENNANVPIRLMLGERELSMGLKGQYYELLGIPAPEDPQQRLVSMRDILNEFGLDRTAELDRTLAAPWVESDSELATAWIQRNAEWLPQIRKAVTREKFYSPALPHDGRLYEILLPDVQNARIVARLLVADAMLNLGNKREGAALDDLFACHRLAAHIGNGWTLVELLVSGALQTMAYDAEEAYLNHARPNRAKQEFWNRRRARLRPVKSAAELLGSTERLIILDSITGIERGQNMNELLGMLAGHLKLKPAVALTLQARIQHPEIDFDGILIAANRHFDEMSEVLAEPDQKTRREKYSAFEKRVNEKGAAALEIGVTELLTSSDAVARLVTDVLLSSLTPAARTARSAEARFKARGDAIEVGWALSAWYAEHRKWPEKLSDLVPAYLSEVPQDRFDGEQIRFTATETNCRVYSVGPNLKDDGGTRREDDPAAYDVGIELRR